MSTHLSEEQVIGYVHQTLTDAAREALDQHLAACPPCRARLADHEALQRRIRHGLSADLRAARPSPRMTFAALAPRLRRPKRLMLLGRPSRRLLSGVAALIPLAIQVVVMLALLSSTSQPVSGSTLTPGGTSATAPDIHAEWIGPADGELPAGWSVEGVYLHNYEAGVDRTVAHTGQASGYVRSAVTEPAILWGHASLLQRFRADRYRGERLRLSAYVRTAAVTGQAVLWMRVARPGNQVRLDNMDDRPLQGTTDWREVEIVLDVPEDSISIEFGIELSGSGQVWADDFQLEVVGQDVLTTKFRLVRQEQAAPRATLP